MVSAIWFNLDQSKNLSSGNGLTLLQKNKILHVITLKVSADENKKM